MHEGQKDLLKLRETNLVSFQLASVYCCSGLVVLGEVFTVILRPLFSSFQVCWSNCQVLMVFWTILPISECPLFASNQLEGLGIARDKLGFLAVPLGFVIGLQGAS